MFQRTMANALLIYRERLADPSLSTLPGFLLRDPTTYGCWAHVHGLTNRTHTASLILDQANHFPLETGSDMTAWLWHSTLLAGCIVHPCRCPRQ